MTRRGITAELLAGVATEIDARRGDRVHAVHEDGALHYRLALRGRHDRADLVVRLDPDFPCAYLQPARPAPAAPSALASALRALLAGGRLDGAAAVPGDRALAVRVRVRGTRFVLWLELFGRQANLYVVDEDGMVALTPRGDIARRRGAAKGDRFEPASARPDGAGAPAEDASAHVRRLAETVATDDALERERIRVARELRRRHKAARSSIEALRAMEARASDADAHRRRGELLRGAFHLLAQGRPRVRVPDYTQDPPGEVEVDVDPDLTPGEQVAACFAAERKARRAGEEARRRRPEAVARLAAIEHALAAVAAASDADALSDAVSTLPNDVRRRLAPQTKGPPRKGPARARPWHVYRSLDGWRILVGRNARGNDRLTLREARPWDLFVHVRASPGSHVIVPTPRGKTVPKDTLLDAAELACLFSARAEAEHNEVDYVPCRHVRKARGAPPGQVVVERARTLQVRRDEPRRNRLKGARERATDADDPS